MLVCAPGGPDTSCYSKKSPLPRAKGCQWEIKSWKSSSERSKHPGCEGRFYFLSQPCCDDLPTMAHGFLLKKKSQWLKQTPRNIHNCRGMPTGNGVPVYPPPKPLQGPETKVETSFWRSSIEQKDRQPQQISLPNIQFSKRFFSIRFVSVLARFKLNLKRTVVFSHSFQKETKYKTATWVHIFQIDPLWIPIWSSLLNGNSFSKMPHSLTESPVLKSYQI